MNRESELVIGLWEAIHDYLPAGKRLEAAVQILRVMVEYDFDEKDLAFIVDEDPYLAKAFKEVFAEESDDVEEYGDDE